MSKTSFTQSSKNISSGFSFTGQSIVNAKANPKGATMRNAGKTMRAGYDATRTNDYNKRAWQNAGPEGLSADERNSNPVRLKLKNRASYEYDNGGFTKRIVNKTANEIVGKKIKVSATSSNKAFNKLFEVEARKWKKSINLERKLRTFARAKILMGEGLATPYTNQNATHFVKLDLAIISCDRLTSFSVGHKDNNIDGVHLDSTGLNVEKYEIAKTTPGSFSFTKETVMYSAKDVYHWFEQEYPEQHRGIPELTPTLELNSSSRRFTVAAVDAAEQAARLSHYMKQGVAFQDEDSEDTQSEFRPLDTFELERGQVTILDKDQEIGTNAAPQPVDTHKDFKESLITEVSAWSPLTMNMILGTSKDMNYSSARFDYYVMFGKDRDIMRDDMECVCLDDLFARFAEELAAYKMINIPEDFEISFAYEADKYLNPQQEAKADLTRISKVGENGMPLQSRKSYNAGRGEDWEEEFEQIESEMLKEAEINIRVEKKIQEMRIKAGLPVNDTEDDNNEE